jgi:ribosome-binding protein aMBF1 (putative translation factor)
MNDKTKTQYTLQEIVAANLKEQRLRLGLSQEGLAE